MYVSLGTVFNTTPGHFETVLLAVRDLPMHVVVTLGPGADVTRFGPQPDHVHLEQFIPQTLLLPHCMAMISHAGSGTTAGGLFYGIPQVLLPRGADQLGIAALCARSGAALVVQPHEVSSEAIRSALDRILTDPKYREGAGRLQAEIMAMPSVDDAMVCLKGEV